MTYFVNWFILLTGLALSLFIGWKLTLGILIGLVIPRIVAMTANPHDDAALAFLDNLLGKGIDKLARWRKER